MSGNPAIITDVRLFASKKRHSACGTYRMPDKAAESETPYYYDFEGANNTYLQFHVDTVYRQADDDTNKQVLRHHLRKNHFDAANTNLEVRQYDREALSNQDQLCIIKCGSELIMRMFKDFSCNGLKVERTFIQDWLNDYRDTLYGICLQRTMCEFQLKDFLNKIKNCDSNNTRCSINITRILQYYKGGFRPPSITGRNLMRNDDLNIDSILQEFQNTSTAKAQEETSAAHARYVLLQHLRQHILNYVISEQRNINILSIYSVFDLLRLYGYTCLLTNGENTQDMTSEEKRIRDAMAMQFATVPDFADDVISACNNHVELAKKQRMPYTKFLK